MARLPQERVSQREYARRLNVSNTAVSKAVEEGKISKGWDKKTKKIIVEKADAEWGNLHRHVEPDVSEITARIKPYDPEQIEQPKPKAEIKKLKVDPDDTETQALIELNDFNLSSKTPFAEALRVEKVARAKLAEIELNKAIGLLVVKDAVHKQLFAFGQEVRQALLVVPDRCIDSVIAAKNRSEAHNILSKELHEALEKLTNPKLDFEPRQ